MLGIISNLIGAQLGEKAQKMQEEARGIGQQLQMNSYLLQDPGAPVHLKQAAHQNLLDLVQEHGSKDVEEQLPQLGQYLTQLAAPSLMQQALQHSAAQDPFRGIGRTVVTPNVDPRFQAPVPSPAAPALQAGQGGSLGAQFRRYLVQPEQEQASPASPAGEPAPSGRTSAVPFDARMEDIMARATPTPPAKPAFDPNAVTPGLTGRPYVSEPPVPGQAEPSPVSSPEEAATAQKPSFRHRLGRVLTTVAGQPTTASAAPAAAPQSFRHRLGSILTGIAYGMQGQTPPERLEQIRLAADLERSRQARAQQMRDLDLARGQQLISDQEYKDARRRIAIGEPDAIAQYRAKADIDVAAEEAQRARNIQRIRDLGPQLKAAGFTDKEVAEFELMESLPKGVKLPGLGGGFTNVPGIVSGQDPELQDAAKDDPRFDPRKAYHVQRDKVTDRIVKWNQVGTQERFNRYNYWLSIVKGMRQYANLDEQAQRDLASQMAYQREGIVIQRGEQQMAIDEGLTGIGPGRGFQLPGGQQQQQQPPTPQSQPPTGQTTAPSVGAPGARSETGALIPAPPGSTPGVDHTADGKTTPVWFGPDGTRYELPPEPTVTPGGTITSAGGTDTSKPSPFGPRQQPERTTAQTQPPPPPRTSGKSPYEQLPPLDQKAVRFYYDLRTAGTGRPTQGRMALMYDRGQQQLGQLTGLGPMAIDVEMGKLQNAKNNLSIVQSQRQAIQGFVGAVDRFGDRLIKNGRKLTDTGGEWLNTKLRDLQKQTISNPVLRQYILDANELQRDYGILLQGGALSRAQLPVSTTQHVQDVVSGNAPLRDVIALVDEIKTGGRIQLDSRRQNEYDIQMEMYGNPVAQAMGEKPPASLKPPASPTQGGPMPKTGKELWDQIRGK